MVKVSSILGSESKKCTTTTDVESSHGVNTGKGEDADDVSWVFSGVIFDNCNVKVVINSTNCDNMWIIQLFCNILWRNKFLLFAWDIIYLEVIYSCYMIFQESVDIWILFQNL